MTNIEYLNYIAKKLTAEELEPYVKWQIIRTIEELLEYYSVEFIQELLPSLSK
ncbi:hypothetical protein [Enterococcus faecalis]|uniref:hypothetical protein n=1 Tax=Enterococcus faecalis TaxID=1351 RepID=UPI002FBE1C17